ncbi:hypothetical protein M408DRAFT_329443 [Serendipita vermifera MAFF 305830]|uniref:Cytochrome P450 n=1 Tax=Serendipita vermifera MAFF 305830 TaxID=933852 RepID=A0A0C2WQ62_SERVB|nr:hypothetical protein M408DRAFT_329443 [Serendipita vermifera MAFF 305830]
MEVINEHLSFSASTQGAIGLTVVLFTYAAASWIRKSTRPTNSSTPPGPPKEFLLGNLRQFPKDHFYQKFCEWQKEYGNIVSVQLPGLSMVIIGSYDVVNELLIKRPNSTGGRKISYMVLELMKWQWSTAFIQPGPSHSNQRKMLRRGIGPQRVGSHTPNIEKNTGKLMLTLHSLEGNPHSEIMRNVGQIVVEITYGEKMGALIGEEISSWSIEALKLITEAIVAFWPVDILHFLRFLPSWAPGGGFQRTASRSAWVSDQLRYVPFEKAKELYASGDIGHSLAADLLDEFGPTDDVRDALAVLFTAGADTTSAAIHLFLHAMFMFPEVAQKVYEEISALTNGDRLLTISDRPHLPYTEAAWLESYRFRPMSLLGIPHCSTKDEVVNGYLIKAGTLLNINNGFILSDPKVWGDPEVFRPERFLAADAGSLPHPPSVIFGFGMRVCPGMYLADRIGFHIAATMVSLFEVTPLKGASRPEPGSTEYTDSGISLPVDFNCRFVPRGTKAEHLLRTIALNI